MQKIDVMKNDREKTRVKGNRIIHTTKGGIYKGDRAERPSGLTTAEAEDQRTGVKIDARHVREAAQGERQATAWGDINERQPQPGTKKRVKTDELTASRKAK